MPSDYQDPEQLTSRDILEQLTRIKSSEIFRAGKAELAILEFVTREALAGCAHAITVPVIAREVFNSDDEGQVRRWGGSLRTKLLKYYDKLGASDPIRIRLEAGSYVPRFELTHLVTISSRTAAGHYSSIPSQPIFVGREHELELVSDYLLRDDALWGVFIAGQRGIGKTALAIRSAHLAPDFHFSRKIFLSAKTKQLASSRVEPIIDFVVSSFTALLSELALEIDEGNLAELRESERPSAVRRALTGKRTLLVIDNIEVFSEQDSIRLLQFLARLPAGCKAIVTSTHRIEVDAHTIILGPLDRTDNLHLIEAIATNQFLTLTDDSERVTLCTLTNGTPLMTRWIVGQLGRQGSHLRTLSAALEYLESAPEVNDPLEYLFLDILGTLTSVEQHVLAALAVLAQPAFPRWIMELTREPEDKILFALQSLIIRAVVTHNSHADTYHLPPLAAVFFKKQHPRLVDFYEFAMARHAIAIATGIKGPGGFERAEAEWPIIIGALPQLLRSRRRFFLESPNTRIQRVTTALFDFLLYSGRWDELLWLVLEAEARAVKSKDYSSAVLRVYGAARVYFTRSALSELSDCIARASSYCEKFRCTAEPRSAVSRMKGWFHQLRGEHSEAVKAFEDQLQTTRQFSRYLGQALEAQVRVDIGRVEQLRDNYADAERLYREALAIAVQLGDPEYTAGAGARLSWVILARGRVAEAETVARTALADSKVIRRQDLIAQAQYTIAAALARQQRGAEGCNYAAEAVSICARLGRRDDLELARSALAECTLGADQSQ
jgi:tetratricopeptide (TPR) repeat protein